MILVYIQVCPSGTIYWFVAMVRFTSFVPVYPMYYLRVCADGTSYSFVPMVLFIYVQFVSLAKHAFWLNVGDMFKVTIYYII